MLKQRDDNIEELDETTNHLSEELQMMKSSTELIEDENHVLKQKAEQLRLNYECSLEEVNLLQSRLKMTEDERNLYLNESITLKDSMTDTEGYNTDLNNDREKLLEQVKQSQDERNTL